MNEEDLRKGFWQQVVEDRAAGRRRSLEQYQSLFPGAPALIAREFAQLGSSGDHATMAPPGAPPPDRRVGPYRLLRELGRGGQGMVFLAEDGQGGARVALKVLHGLAAATESQRARFRREAEVAGRLDHPGIGALLGAGLDGDLPWLAMRFVEGESLAARIAAARAAGDAAPAPAPAAATSVVPGARTPDHVAGALRYFEKAARALHAAHEAGVIHRDVKPGNLMITPDDEPVILDFGLAREVEGVQPALTQDGVPFGTPAYMAPEQIAGPSGALDARADVYGLGVALYETLTLALPFDAPTRERLFHEILTQSAPDPRRLRPHLPADLGLVLGTALEKDRERRYRTALDFAEDLRRLREGQPVRARAPGAWLRLRRWAAAHPAPATAAAGAFVVLAVALGLSLVFLRRIRDERDQKDGALRRADASFDRALDAVNELLARVGDLDEVPHAARARQALLEKAVRLFEGIAGEESRDLRVRSRTAVAHVRLGDLYAGLGQRERADEESGRAVTLFEALFAERPSPEHRLGLARALHTRGKLLRDRGRLPAAEESLVRAVGLLGSAGSHGPGSPTEMSELAYELNTLAVLEQQTGRVEPALARLLDALAWIEKARAAEPRAPEHALRYMTLLRNASSAHMARGEFDRAHALSVRRIAVIEELLASAPAHPGYRLRQAETLGELGHVLGALGRADEARTALARAQEIVAPLLESAPHQPSVVRAAATIAETRAVLFESLKEWAEGAAARERARELWERLVRDLPGEPEPRLDLVRVILGQETDADGTPLSPGEREERLAQALEQTEALHREQPTVPGHWKSLVLIHYELASLQFLDGRPADAARHLRDAETLGVPPAEPGMSGDLWDSFVAQLVESRRPRALEQMAQELARVAPEDAALRLRAATLLARRAAQAARKDAEGARELGDRAMEHLKAAVRLGLPAERLRAEAPRLGPVAERADFRELLGEPTPQKK
jgi:serine/threonine protein kinase